MREGKRPKLCRILYKNSGSLTGFQLEFTDGLKSPMFETERAKKKDQVCFTDVDYTRRISKVSMRVASTFEKDLSKFRLSDNKGKHVVDLVWFNCQEGKWLTRDIQEN